MFIRRSLYAIGDDFDKSFTLESAIRIDESTIKFIACDIFIINVHVLYIHQAATLVLISFCAH